jgi:hypothetical protein
MRREKRLTWRIRVQTSPGCAQIRALPGGPRRLFDAIEKKAVLVQGEEVVLVVGSGSFRGIGKPGVEVSCDPL